MDDDDAIPEPRRHHLFAVWHWPWWGWAIFIFLDGLFWIAFILPDNRYQ